MKLPTEAEITKFLNENIKAYKMVSPVNEAERVLIDDVLRALAVMLNTTHKSDLQEENRRLREALYPHPGVRNTHPLILYFDTRADVDEFIALCKEAKPNMKAHPL